MKTNKKNTEKASNVIVEKRKRVHAGREYQNKIRKPLAHRMQGKLWQIANDLRDSILASQNREPAKFEFLDEVRKSGINFPHDSISQAWFYWRKFHGIAGRAAGLSSRKVNSETAILPEKIEKIERPPLAKETPALLKKVVATKTTKSKKAPAKTPITKTKKSKKASALLKKVVVTKTTKSKVLNVSAKSKSKSRLTKVSEKAKLLATV